MAGEMGQFSIKLCYKYAVALRLALIVLALVVFVPRLINNLRGKPQRTFVVSTDNCTQSPATNQPFYSEDFVPNESMVASVHSPALAQLANGELLAVWFGGTREGARDVALYTSIWNPLTQTWSATGPLVTQEQTQREVGRYIKKLGNPVLYTDARRRTWVFFISVSIGGWSFSQINFKTTSDNGNTWSPAKRLMMTPLFNFGTLVKGQPYAYSDSTIGLPVYRDHAEFASFAELAILNEEGEVIDKVRISHGTSGGGQPSIVPLDTTRALGFLRYKGSEPRRILFTQSGDAGQTWTPPIRTGFLNPDSALMALRLRDGTLLIVFNNSTQDRGNLSLAKSSDEGASWKATHVFEDEKGVGADGAPPEFSYPYILQTCDGNIHLLYAWNRKRIKHVTFNEAWVRANNG